MKIVYFSSNFKGAVFRACLAIIFGIVLLVWPDEAPKYIVKSIGAVFFITGLAAFILSSKNHGDSNRGMVPFTGVGSMVLGVILFSIPLTFTAVLVFLLGMILIVVALGQFFTLSAARQLGMVAGINYLYPTLIIIAGFIILLNPYEVVGKVAGGASVIFGVMAIFYGVTNLWNNYLLYKYRRSNGNHMEPVRLGDKHDEIEDIPYEEVKD
jgi:uncharacterized membrane protein HdeD (DUF308 family)